MGVFMIEEPDDLTMIMMPKLDFDSEEIIEEYAKTIKRCKNIEQLKSVLYKFYTHISSIVSLQNDIQYLQDRAKELEFNIKMFQQEHGSE
jgi:predicted phage-related endonuclease